MKKTTLHISRVLLLLGLLLGFISLFKTISHVGDETYLLITQSTEGAYHAWYHAFRESFGDISAVVILLLIFFGNKDWRTPQTWFISLILMIGYYAPFWIGTPFIPELKAPHMAAEIVHILMAAFSLGALFTAKKYFFKK